MKTDINPMQRVKTLLTIGAFCCPNAAQASDVIRFSCSWDNQRPIEIVVSPDGERATRSDDGWSYKVIKVTKWGVWLLVDNPSNVVAAAIQMIERSTSSDDPTRGGKWLDMVVAITGTVSPIVGGICSEE